MARRPQEKRPTAVLIKPPADTDDWQDRLDRVRDPEWLDDDIEQAAGDEPVRKPGNAGPIPVIPGEALEGEA